LATRERRHLASTPSIDGAQHEEPERDEGEGEGGLRPGEGDADRRFFRRVASRMMERTRSSSIEKVTASMPARRNASEIAASRPAAASSNRRRNAQSPVST